MAQLQAAAAEIQAMTPPGTPAADPVPPPSPVPCGPPGNREGKSWPGTSWPSGWQWTPAAVPPGGLPSCPAPRKLPLGDHPHPHTTEPRKENVP